MIEISSHRQQKQTKVLFEETFLMISSGVLQRPRIKSKALGTKIVKAQVYGTRFAMLEGKYTTMTREISPAIATTNSTKM